MAQTNLFVLQRLVFAIHLLCRTDTILARRAIHS